MAIERCEGCPIVRRGFVCGFLTSHIDKGVFICDPVSNDQSTKPELVVKVHGDRAVAKDAIEVVETIFEENYGW